MNPKVYVAAISDPKNGNKTMKRLELRSEHEKSNQTESGKIGFLLAGATGPKGTVAPNVEKRVCWENISLQNMEKWGIKVGDVLEEKIGQPCKILVEERFVPFYEGQQAKRAGNEGAELTKDGKKIYRNSRLTLNMAEQDTLIQHDIVSTAITSVSSEFSNASTLGEKVTS